MAVRIAGPPLRILAAWRFWSAVSGGSLPRLVSMASSCVRACWTTAARAAFGSGGGVVIGAVGGADAVAVAGGAGATGAGLEVVVDGVEACLVDLVDLVDLDMVDLRLHGVAT